MTSPVWRLLVALLLLAGASGAVLVTEARLQHSREEHAAEFQRLVGGLGFGPALDLSGCAFGFDPRLDGSCAEEYGPLPGGNCFCPRHAGSILYYPSPPRSVPVWLLEEADAPPS
jgi:hypothetical protein